MEDWCSTDDEDNASANKTGLKRSASSQGFAATSSGLVGVKETRSCSGPFDNCRDTGISKYQHDVESYIEGLFREKQQAEDISLTTTSATATTVVEGPEQAAEAISNVGSAEPGSKHLGQSPGVPTKDIASNRIVMVQPDLLLYRGRQYSIQDIATAWKKDCRMWLWKGEKQRNQSLNDLKTKLDSMSLNN